MSKTCANCAYWCQYSRGSTGECRRHAPAPMYSMTGDKPGPIWWPQTLLNFWCGDFEMKNHPMVTAMEVPDDNYVPEWNKLIAAARNPEKSQKIPKKNFSKKSKKETS